MNTKRILAAAFSLKMQGKRASPRAMASLLGYTRGEVEAAEEKLRRDGLLRSDGEGVYLTPEGRKRIRVVFIGGGFEVIHYGHIYTISRARALGDVLVVSVARDSTLRRRKNRVPIAGEKARVKMLSALRQVDAAILGVEGDIYVTLRRVGPDVVALGYDQYHMEEEVEREAKKRGMKLKVVRLGSPHPEMKTRRILREL